MRPKYLLSDYSGKLMIENSVKNFIDKYRVTITILKTHDEMFDASNTLRRVFGNRVDICILDTPTKGPADTVYQTIKSSRHIADDASILIKDCDGFYDAEVLNGNRIYYSRLSANPDIRNAGAKSYVKTNNQGIVAAIVEKSIVSDMFCVGGYQFESAGSFVNSYETLSETTCEIFVSDIVDVMINTRHSVFVASEVSNFVDVGTAEEWFKYNDKPTYFCDIDGTLVKSKMPYDDQYEPLEQNVGHLLRELGRGCKIIFCTARPSEYRAVTRAMLDVLGFRECELIMDVHHSRRILINDYASTNPYPSALAINIKRDTNTIGDMI
jgi:hypothetical protein